MLFAPVNIQAPRHPLAPLDVRGGDNRAERFVETFANITIFRSAFVKNYRQVAGFILAGGASSRMGGDKALLDFGGVPLILHTARLLEPLVAEITVIGAPSRYATLGLRTTPDIAEIRSGSGKPGGGPLAGIATALATTRSRWNLIVACDLPYLSTAWLDWLLSRAVHSHGEALIPRTKGGLEPLAAVYRRECVAPIAVALARGVRKVSDALEELRVELVYPREWHGIDPDELVLKNMNAPADYEQARKWWAAGNPRGTEHVRSSRKTPKRKRRSAPRRRK